MYQKVLVPLDGSELAESALPHVKSMLKDGAVGEITLINVVTVYLSAHGEYSGPVNINTIRENLIKESKKYLEDVKSRLGSEGIHVKTESLEANRTAEAISDYARKNGMDLIVIATHGYTGLKKLMLGSVALGVLHESHIPVLLIRPESCRR